MPLGSSQFPCLRLAVIFIFQLCQHRNPLFNDYDKQPLKGASTAKISTRCFDNCLTNLWPLCRQLNQEALTEHAQKLRSLPAEAREAVNVCVGAHFPELVDEAGDKKAGAVGYGDVFLG